MLDLVPGSLSPTIQKFVHSRHDCLRVLRILPDKIHVCFVDVEPPATMDHATSRTSIPKARTTSSSCVDPGGRGGFRTPISHLARDPKLASSWDNCHLLVTLFACRYRQNVGKMWARNPGLLRVPRAAVADQLRPDPVAEMPGSEVLGGREKPVRRPGPSGCPRVPRRSARRAFSISTVARAGIPTTRLSIRLRSAATN